MILPRLSAGVKSKRKNPEQLLRAKDHQGPGIPATKKLPTVVEDESPAPSVYWHRDRRPAPVLRHAAEHRGGA